jgi:electron transfer flavoprotein beta subunit
MKVLAAVKEVATLDDEFEIDGLSVPERYVTYDLNEWDSYALETAVNFAEDADEDVEVVTVTVGPERAEETIRQALAKGADRAIRVWDDDLAAAETVGPRERAQLLAAVAEREDPDFVVSGVQSGDEAFAATGVATASRLGYEWAAVVNELSVNTDAGVANLHRELEGGVEEVSEVELPAVFTIQTGINEPRYASLRGIRQAQSKPLDVLSLTDLDLSADALESPLRQTAMTEPESEGDATVWSGDAEETSEQLAELLRDKGVVEA